VRRVRTRGLSPLAAGLVALVVIAIGCYFGFTKSNPFADNFEIKAAFKTANDVKPKSPVRIAGVNVGIVKSVETITEDPDGAGAIVTMEIQDKGLPIKKDATFKIRPRIFLEGNYFVEVQPGSPSAEPVQEGAVIPVQQTAAPVQFGQVLTALQSDTREDLRIVLDEYGRALADGGAKGYNRSIDYWPGAFKNSAIVNEATLGKLEHDLTNYIRGADRFARGLNRNPEALKSLVTDFATTAGAFASQRDALQRAIDELPDTLTVGFRALGELNEAFPPLRRLTADLRPAVRSSGPALDATLPLVKQLRRFTSEPELKGLVRDLRPLVPELTELNEGGVPLQKELRLLSSCSNEVVIPWRNDKIDDPVFPASGPVYEEQVKWLPGIAAESRNFDANGQYVRSLANGANYAYPANDGRIFTTGLPLQGVNPPRADSAPPLRPDVACETQQQPDLRSRPQAPPTAIKVNHSSPAAVAMWNEQKDKAIKLIRSELARIGEGQIKISDKEFSLDDMPKLLKARPSR
jgi:phospholipid/cholesterol/gamma-HCH transport system substrate-binding protein